jgi:hypothetical protein
MIVYLLRNTVNGKGYVGQTILTLQQRWNGAVRKGRKLSDSHKAALSASLKGRPKAPRRLAHARIETLPLFSNSFLPGGQQ